MTLEPEHSSSSEDSQPSKQDPPKKKRGRPAAPKPNPNLIYAMPPKKKPKEIAGFPSVSSLPKTVPWDKVPEEKKDILAIPSVFCRKFLGMELYDNQAAIMDGAAPHGSRTSLRTCNESGKTSKIITGLILWHSIFGTSISTSGSWAQVTNQLVPNLKRFQNKFPEWEFNATTIQSKKGPKWIGFSVSEEGRAEGYHGYLDRDPMKDVPLMAFIDEWKSVPRGIEEAIDRCNPQRFLGASSPGYAEGGFYDSQTKNAALYKCYKIDYTQCPHIDPETIAKRIKKYGLNHPLVRSMLFAEFMELVEGAIINLKDIEDCMEYPPKQGPGDRRAACDFAAGGDENVLAFRIGNRVTIEDAWFDRNTMSAVGKFITHFKRLSNQYGLRPDEIDCDADGLGRSMVDAIREAGWPVNDFHGGSGAHQDHYFNRITECWHEAAAKIAGRQIILPNDEDFRAQAINRKVKHHSKGKLWIESKAEMKDRGVSSPDRADAVCVAIADQPFSRSINISDTGRGREKRVFIDWESSEGIESSILDGINAG